MVDLPPQWRSIDGGRKMETPIFWMVFKRPYLHAFRGISMSAWKSLAISSRLVNPLTKDPNTQQVASRKLFPQLAPTLIHVTHPNHEQKHHFSFTQQKRAPKKRPPKSPLPFPPPKSCKLVAWSSKAAHFSRLTTTVLKVWMWHLFPLKQRGWIMTIGRGICCFCQQKPSFWEWWGGHHQFPYMAWYGEFHETLSLTKYQYFLLSRMWQEVMWYLPFPWLNESIVIVSQSELPPANDLKTSKFIVIITQSELPPAIDLKTPVFWGRFPCSLIFFNWVETTN